MMHHYSCSIIPFVVNSSYGVITSDDSDHLFGAKET